MRLHAPLRFSLNCLRNLLGAQSTMLCHFASTVHLVYSVLHASPQCTATKCAWYYKGKTSEVPCHTATLSWHLSGQNMSYQAETTDPTGNRLHLACGLWSKGDLSAEPTFLIHTWGLDGLNCRVSMFRR